MIFGVAIGCIVTGGWLMSSAWYRYRYFRPQISLLIPYRAEPGSPRARLWNWLERYWEWELPDAEIVVGKSKGKVFSKSQAINDAARRAHGRVFVIIDADTYMTGPIIKMAADMLDDARRREFRLWLVPYRNTYRLSEAASERMLASDPRRPFRPHSPPDPADVIGTQGSGAAGSGHRFGAMIVIVPREGFEPIRYDERFRGWGSEDVCFLRSMDTLYARHQTLNADVISLYHPAIGKDFTNRMWSGQLSPQANSNLAMKYNRATGDRAAMQRLVTEGHHWEKRQRWLERSRKKHDR